MLFNVFSAAGEVCKKRETGFSGLGLGLDYGSTFGSGYGKIAVLVKL